MPTCCVYTCNNCSSSKTKKQKELEMTRQITFHKFPCNPERRAAWVKFIRWPGCPDWEPSKFSNVCSEHFSEDSFDRSSLSYVRLRDTAVPTIFTANPTHLIQKVENDVHIDILNDHCYIKTANEGQENTDEENNSRIESEELENEEDTKCEDCQRVLTYSSAFMKLDGSIVCDKCAVSQLELPNATIPPTILEILTCSSCRNFLSHGPVFLKQTEEAICGQCVNPGDIVIRNKHYEALARLFKFPCRFQKFGCGESVPFAENSEDSPHERICLFRGEPCPILINDSECSWIGKTSDLLEHCGKEHSELVFENPCCIMYDLQISNVFTFVLTAFNLLFLLHTKVCLETSKIFHTVQHFSKSHNDICETFKYKLDIKIKRGSKVLTRLGVITSRCKFDYNSKDFMVTDFSVLKKSIGESRNCIFTVTIVRISDFKETNNT